MLLIPVAIQLLTCTSTSDAGVVDTCGYLCELLEEETHSQALEFACDIICDVEGIREFIKLINR